MANRSKSYGPETTRVEKRLTLLHEHDNPRRQGRTAIARYREQFQKLREEVLSFIDLLLELNANVCIVCVSGGLEIAWS